MSIWLLQMCASTALEYSLSIMYNVEHGRIPTGIEVGKNVPKCFNHSKIGFGRHGADKGGVQVVDVCHKHILHVAEGSYEVGTSALGVHHPVV
jgi:hypothetical protein